MKISLFSKKQIIESRIRWTCLSIDRRLFCIPSTEGRVIQKKLNRFVCLCRVKGQKAFSLNIEYYEFSSKMVNKLVKFLTLENGVKVYVACRGQKKNFPYRSQRRFSYPVVTVHQNKLEVFEREESEVVISFLKH